MLKQIGLQINLQEDTRPNFIARKILEIKLEEDKAAAETKEKPSEQIGTAETHEQAKEEGKGKSK